MKKTIASNLNKNRKQCELLSDSQMVINAFNNLEVVVKICNYLDFVDKIRMAFVAPYLLKINEEISLAILKKYIKDDTLLCNSLKINYMRNIGLEWLTKSSKPISEAMQELRDSSINSNQKAIIMNSILLNLPYYKDIDKSCFSASFFNSVKDGAVDIFRYYIREKMTVQELKEVLISRSTQGAQNFLTIVKNNDLTMVKILYGYAIEIMDSKELTAFVNMPDVSYSSYRQNALMIAARNNSVEMFDWLLNNGARLNQLDSSKKNALMYASNYGNHVIVERILNYLSNDHEAIIELANKTTDRFDGRCNALMLVCRFHRHTLTENYRRCAELLLPFTDVNAVNAFNQSALILAVDGGSLEVVRELLIHGKDINLFTTKDSKSVLMLAAEGYDNPRINKNYTGIAQTLIEHAKKWMSKDEFSEFLNLKDSEGNTALMIATKEIHVKIIDLLYDLVDEDQQNLCLSTREKQLADFLEQHDTKMGDINKLQGWENETLLMQRAGMCSESEVHTLLFHNDIDVNMTNEYGETALMIAVRNHNHHCIEVLLPLVDDVNRSDKNGVTLLMKAASVGNIETVELLLRHENIDLNTIDDTGATALVHAARASEYKGRNRIPFYYERYEKVVDMLLSKGDFELQQGELALKESLKNMRIIPVLKKLFNQMFNSECNICKEKKEEMMREITKKFEISEENLEAFFNRLEKSFPT